MLGIVALLTVASAAQKPGPPKLEPAIASDSHKQLIREGIALHDEGDYDDAISRYEAVLRESPNNVQALYEMSFSYFAKKDFQKSIEAGYKAAQYKSDLLGTIYVQLGSSFDELGEPKKAIQIYEAGIKLEPTDFLLHYNLAITYRGTGQLDDARVAVKKAAILNPAHPSSQLLLSGLFEKGGYKIPALLAACRFLILEPRSTRSDSALRLVATTMQAGVSAGKNPNRISISLDPSPQKKDEGDFSSIDTFMGLMKASNYLEKNQSKTEMELLAENFGALIAFLTESPNKSDPSKFVWKYYVPYFLEMKNKGHLEAFTYYTNQRSNIAGVNDWLSQNQPKIVAFLVWSKNYQWPKVG
ncbi:MAG: tetratricopeptide repeat protein [Pyrinomonadaceae bacterium]